MIRSNVRAISIRDGAELKLNGWTLAPEAKPDVYEALLPNGVPHRVTFITDVDSIGFMVELGARYDFIVSYRDTLAYTQIVGVRLMPAAVFDSAFRAAKPEDAGRGARGLRAGERRPRADATARSSPGLVHAGSAYHAEVRRWFDRHAGHRAVAMLDSALKQSPRAYASLKMNGYAFAFDARGRIVPGGVYDRLGPPAERTNALLPYLDELQRFADASGFRRFYRQHRRRTKRRPPSSRHRRRGGGTGVARAQLRAREPFDLLTLVFSPPGGRQRVRATPQSKRLRRAAVATSASRTRRSSGRELRGCRTRRWRSTGRNAPSRIQRAYSSARPRRRERIL